MDEQLTTLGADGECWQTLEEIMRGEAIASIFRGIDPSEHNGFGDVLPRDCPASDPLVGFCSLLLV